MRHILNIINDKKEHSTYSDDPIVLTHQEVDLLFQNFKDEYEKGFTDGSEVKEKKTISLNLGICFVKQSEVEKHPVVILRNNPFFDGTVKAECLNIVSDNMGLWDRIKTAFHFFKTLKQYITTKTQTS